MALGGRKPKATHLKIVTGDPGKRGVNRQEPKARGTLGEPPETFTPEQQSLWHEVVNSAPAGVLTGSDRLLVEIAVRNLATIRDSKGAITAAQSAEMRRCLGEMGMTPSERSRLTDPAAGTRNAFAALDE